MKQCYGKKKKTNNKINIVTDNVLILDCFHSCNRYLLSGLPKSDSILYVQVILRLDLVCL